MKSHPSSWLLAAWLLLVGCGAPVPVRGETASGSSAGVGDESPPMAAVEVDGESAGEVEPAAGEDEPDPLAPVTGPLTVTLGEGLMDLDVPAGYSLFNPQATQILLEANGGFPDGSELGLLVPEAEGQQFFVVIRFDETGYVSSDDADHIDADQLLETIREGTAARNPERVERGFSEIHVTRWGETPRFDRSRKHLVWAIEAESKGHPVVNYNTRLLGRRGYVSMNLVTDPTQLSRDKVAMETILGGVAYRPGQRYQDFDPKTDKDSGMSLGNLILGGGALAAVAKKGLLAKLFKFLLTLVLAGKKVIIGLVVGFFAMIRGRKSEGPEAGD